MRCAAVLVVGAAALVLPTAALAAPASISLDTAQSVMLTAREAKTLSVPADSTREFAHLAGSRIPNGIWLCDLESEDSEVEIAAGRDLYLSQYMSDSMPERRAAQEVHAFASSRKAKDTYSRVVKGARQCDGTWTTTSGPYTFTVKVTSGRGTAEDGSSFVWVRSLTVAADQKTGWVDHDYVVVQRGGRYVQSLAVHRAGRGADPWSAGERSRIDAMGPELLSRWMSAAG